MLPDVLSPKVAARKERRRREKCAEFGCKEKTGADFRCLEHKKDHARRERERRARKAGE